jgi:hypothetical protein
MVAGTWIEGASLAIGRSAEGPGAGVRFGEAALLESA